MAGKSDRTQREREYFNTALQRHLTPADLEGFKAARAVAQRWSSIGSFCGLTLGCVVGFPYSRKFSNVLISTLRQIRAGTLGVPTGATPLSYSMARAHKEAAEAIGSRKLREGAVSMRQFTGSAIKASVFGALWALFFGAAGRSGGALMATWRAEQIIKDAGGDPERIRNAVDQIVIDLWEAKRTSGSNKEARLPSERQMDGAGFSVDLNKSAERAAGDLDSRPDQDSFLRGAGPPSGDEPNPATKPNFSRFESRLNESVMYIATGEDDGTYREREVSSEQPEEGGLRSRWEELRNNRQQAPSTWERIRQEQGRPSIRSAVSRTSSVEEPAELQSEEQREKRQADFAALLEYESKGGDDQSEVRSQERTSRWI